MNTFDRINRLRQHYNWLPLPSPEGRNISDLLDALDRRAGIDTTGGRSLGRSLINGKAIYGNQVGHRLRLLEAARHHFWLGADA